MSCVEVETSKVDSRGQIPCTLDQCATVLSTVFRKKEWTSAHSLWVLFPGIVEGSPSAPTEREIARTPGGVLYASGTAVVISRSAEPQMKTSMCFIKAIIAMAHTLARLVYRMLKFGHHDVARPSPRTSG